MEFNFIKQLSKKQIRLLILLGFLEYNDQFKENNFYDIYEYDDIKINYKPYQTIINYDIYNQKNNYVCSFLINNYSMILEDKNFELDLSSVLKLYLTYEFGEEYIKYLYNKNIEEAKQEKQNLIENSSTILDKHGLTKLNQKIKTIAIKK